ncbi:CHAP domain-containing protein [Spirosoma fluviale]|uniref:CHAP domain-containing protein n=1 Tax=Spirosoma fluviale TaxID=1597977 RepID=A0A286FCR8_9BACT|nr:CHAP domain-containing protein [Spirosoma fluviale]SOD81037.1 CHAP domain-containing protein [Spirosoma fluviale]
MSKSNAPASVAEQIRRLRQLGWAVCDTPGYTLTDTLLRFQHASVTPEGKRLTVDGEYGPQTQSALFDVYAPSLAEKLPQRVLVVAASQVGVSEVPVGSNAGPQIDMVLSSVGLGRGYPWCAAFVYWCFGQASRQLGVKNPCPKTAGVLNLWDLAGYRSTGLRRITAAQAQANPALVKPGMQFLLKLGSTSGHTGLVERVGAGGQLITLEGNTNQALSREGTGVFRLSRRTVKSVNLGFIEYA